MQKSSNSDYDGQTIATVPLLIGKKGLDLREAIDPEALTSLINAKFTDNVSVDRRTGHTSKLLQDSSNFHTEPAHATDTWLYGFGVVQETSNKHFPIHNQSLATFNYDGADVSWTGDRLLVHSDVTEKCLGASSYWNNNKGGPIVVTTVDGDSSFKEGIPCYLPSLLDKSPPVKVTKVTSGDGAYDCAISDTLIVIVYTQGFEVFTQVIDRATGNLIKLTQMSNGIVGATPRVIFSSNKFVTYWLNTATNELFTSEFNGLTWSTAVTPFIANTYDIYQEGANGGYYLIYRNINTLRARFYFGSVVQPAPFAADTILTVTGGVTPLGPCAITSSVEGKIAIVFYTNSGYHAREFTSNLVAVGTQVQISSLVATPDACSIISRSASSNNAQDGPCWITYCGYENNRVVIRSFANAASTLMDTRNIIRFNCTLVSRAFRVGDEVFVWLQSGNFPVNFLVSGLFNQIVCGYADFGEAVIPPSLSGAGRALADVSKDIAGPYKFIWARTLTGADAGVNRLRFSEINFLPQITAVKYGSSMYLSGSAVQNFDGFECSDAGFRDIPIVTGAASVAGGGLSNGTYQIRVYAVRYNNKGERFISAALTSPTAVTGAATHLDWSIKTLQSCTSNDVIFEVYRTAAGGTNFTLEGTIANNKGASTVTFTSTLSDAAIAANAGDPFQAQLGGLPQLLERGPTGCTTLLNYNDRLWGIGGQVPSGKVQFSKLKRDEFGAAFSTLINTTIVDSEAGEITSIGGINDAVAVFQRDRIFIIQGEGPDNFGRGNFPAARFTLAKGATNHFGTLLTDIGLVYWNKAGPHLLTGQFTVENISDQIRPLAVNFTPTGVRVNPQNQEIIWYTSTGTAFLWDYKTTGRWATWSNLFVNGVSPTALAFRNGLLLIPDDTVYTDGGQEYIFSGRTAQLAASQLLQGYTILKRYGIVGTYGSEHTVTFRVYYNGSPLWEESEIWQPEADTYLQQASDFGSLTAAQVDALVVVDKSGNYSTHLRAKRQNCQRFQLEFLDNGPNGPGFKPQYLEFELGARPGFGRTAKTTFTDN